MCSPGDAQRETRNFDGSEPLTAIPDITRKWGSVRMGHDKIRLSLSNRQWLLICRQANKPTDECVT